MPYVYGKVDSLEGTEKVGTHQCAVLVQYYAKVPKMKFWKAGDLVKGDNKIKKGTAIATFVNGEYPPATGKHHGHGHAAFYMSQDDTGIEVMDQWVDDATKPQVSSRRMAFKGKDSKSNFRDISNNADALYVIEQK